MKNSSVSMVDYIIDFEQRYNRMGKYNMTLSDTVLAFKLLDTACLNVKSKWLALTACGELKFSSIKLARIFGGKPTGSSNGIQVKRDKEQRISTKQRPHGRKKWDATF